MRRPMGIVFALLLAAFVSYGGFGAPARAQDGTPTSVATSDDPRAGRLGGRIDDFEERYGRADSKTDKFYSYDNLEEFGAKVDIQVYKSKIVSINVEWDEDPGITEPEAKAVAAELIPADAECRKKAVSNEWGDNVILCHSASLERAFTRETMNKLAFSGSRGDLNYSLDINDSGDSTLTVRLGEDKYVAPTPTPIPPTPTPTFDEKLAQYTPVADIRELAIRPGGFIGQKVSFSGTILTIQVASPGRVFVLGDQDPISAEVAMQVTVAAPDGSTETIFVAYDGDTTGMFEGSYVTVFGEVVDTQSGTNLLGGAITQPLVKAFYVTL